MLEIAVTMPLAEYEQVRLELEKGFNQHGIVCVLSADTVIRTWSRLKFHDWFENQDTFVDHYIGWGEIFRDAASEPMLAAATADFVDQFCQVRVMMIFHDDDEDAEYTQAVSSLAVMFKLAFGGR